MRLDLNLVELFCCVVEAGSFSGAAKKLSLSQPTVSGHVKNLEGYVGVPLIDRLPRRIALTRAGELLYRHGRAILREKEAAARELAQFVHGLGGGLVLCGSTIPTEYLLPPIVAAFHASFPGISVEMRVSDSRQACEDLLAGRAELGFVGARFESAGLSFRHFAADELVLVVPNSKKWEGLGWIALEDLLRKPFLARESGSGTRVAFEKAIGRPLDAFNVVGSFGSTNAVKEAIKAGLGVSVLSIRAVEWELAAGLLKVVKIRGVSSMTRDFFAAINKRLTLSPIAESFLECALQAHRRPAEPSAARTRRRPR